MPHLQLAGRTDVDEYFEISGVFQASKLTHTPFLVFVVKDDDVTVRIVESAAQLLTYPDDTKVMGQWRGEWRSDFFQFTVGDYRVFAEDADAPLKTATNVTKVVGPQGGLRYLSYEYIDERGNKTHRSTALRDEVARLEAFFGKHGIQVQVQRAK